MVLANHQMGAQRCQRVVWGGCVVLDQQLGAQCYADVAWGGLVQVELCELVLATRIAEAWVVVLVFLRR